MLLLIVLLQMVHLMRRFHSKLLSLTVDGTAIVTNADKLFTLKNVIRKEIVNYGGGDIFDPKVNFSRWKHDIQDFIKVNEDYISNETTKIHLIASRL